MFQSPVNALPVELLTEIFIACLPEDLTPNSNESPLLLCRICRTWRSIALGTPKLWCSIRLSGRHSPHVKDIIATWQSRSHPLQFSIDAVLHGDGSYQAMPCLYSFSRLWRTLELSKWEDVVLFIGAPISSLAALERTVLWSNDPRIYSRLGPDIYPLLPLPWHQLTHMEYRTYTPADTIIAIISQCRRLVDVQFGLTRARDLPLTEAIVTAPSIQFLRVLFSDGGISSICDQLILPNLRFLEWEFENNPVPPSFTMFLSHFSFTLETLCLTRFHVPESNLIEVMALLTSLRTLSLSPSKFSRRMISDRTILAMTVLPGSNNILPKLENIHFGEALYVSPKGFAEMVGSRWNRGGGGAREPLTRRLRRVDVSFNAGMNDHVRTVIQGYRDEGLEIP